MTELQKQVNYLAVELKRVWNNTLDGEDCFERMARHAVIRCAKNLPANLSNAEQSAFVTWGDN